MTDDDADPIAAGLLLLHLQTYESAVAMLILTHLCAKALIAATPPGITALDKSCRVFFEGVVSTIGRELRKNAPHA